MRNLTRALQIMVIVLAALAVFMLGIVLYHVPDLKADTDRILALQDPLEAEAASLEQAVMDAGEQTLEKILTGYYTSQDLAGIARKQFACELRVNGIKISPSNARMDCAESCLEITVTESMMPGDFPAKWLKKFSRLTAASITVQATSSSFTSVIRDLPDRTLLIYTFPMINVGEIVTISINDPYLAAAIGLEGDRMEITHCHE